MNKSILHQKIAQTSKKNNSFLCVGLDSDYNRLPLSIKKGRTLMEAIFGFNKEIIDSTNVFAAVFKINPVFYAGFGLEGLKAMLLTNRYIKKNYPNMAIIADCKRAEMLHSGELAAKEIFDEFLFDALTVSPWMGFDSIKPYTKYKDKGVFVLCKDTNPTATEIQDISVNDKKIFEIVTEKLINDWNKSGNVFCEGPLTYPDSLSRIRKISGDDMLILVSGYGPQGGKAENLKNAFSKNGDNIIVNASRSVIFASSGKDFAKASADSAKKIRDQINFIKQS